MHGSLAGIEDERGSSTTSSRGAARLLGAEGRTALGNALVKALSVPVEKASRLLLTVIAAPMLGAAAFGSYQFGVAATTMLALCTDLGTGVWTTRALARDRARAPAVVGTAMRIRLLALPPTLALIAVLALVAGARDRARGALLLIGVGALASAFVDYFGAVFRGYERLSDEARVNVARAVLVTACGLAALRVGRSVAALAAGILAGTLVAGAYGLGVVRRRYPAIARGGAYDRGLARDAKRAALPLWLATMLSMLYFKGDVVILRVFVDDAEIGAYSAAYKVFEGLMIAPAVLLAATFPPLARAQHDASRRRRWEAALAALLLLGGAAVGAVVYLAGDRIVGLLFGAGFARAVPSLRVLALALPILFLNFGLTHFLIARDLERRNLLFAALMLVVNVGVNLIAIPRLGGRGAAWATLVTELALTACCLAALRLGDGTRREPASAPGG